MRSTHTLFLVSLLIALALQPAHAQGGVFRGVVTGDTLGHPIARAEVVLPELRRTTSTTERGEFRFNDLPAGHYDVAVRAIGFQLFTASIDIVAGGMVDADLSLLPVVAILDSVRTTASATPKSLPKYDGFEARQKAHISGYFLSDSMLRRRGRENLESVIAMLPSVADKGGVLYTTHGGSSAGPAFKAGPGGGMGPCPFSVYVDDVKIFQLGNGNAAPDFSKMHVEDYYGVEVYPSSASAPVQYTPTGPNCGVIVLWTRPLNHPYP